MFTRLLVVVAALLGAGCSQAPSAPAITVTDAWARATAAGQSTGAIYATIANDGGADRLVAVASDRGMPMLHANEVKDGVSRMRMLGSVPIPGGGSVTLAPGGSHIMLGGLTAPLRAGERLQLKLRFATAGERTVDVAVVPPGSR